MCRRLETKRQLNSAPNNLNEYKNTLNERQMRPKMAQVGSKWCPRGAKLSVTLATL